MIFCAVFFTACNKDTIELEWLKVKSSYTILGTDYSSTRDKGYRCCLIWNKTNLLWECTEKNITKEDITLLTHENIEVDIFKFIDDIINKNKTDAIKAYKELLKQNEEPIKIIALLASKFRLMYQASSLAKSGYTEDQISTILDTHKYPVHLAIVAGYKYNPKILLKYLSGYYLQELGPMYMEHHFLERLYEQQGFLREGDYAHRFKNLHEYLDDATSYLRLINLFKTRNFSASTEDFVKIISDYEMLSEEQVLPYIYEQCLGEDEQESIMYILSILRSMELYDASSSFEGDHLKILNKYIKIDTVIANDKKIPSKTAKKYESEEQKDQVKIDKKEIEKMGCLLISDKIYTFSKVDGTIKHEPLKTSYLIFSYLMEMIQ